MLIALCLFAFHWYLSLFCQSFFLHRYSSHKMFSMHPVFEKFFYLLTFASQGPSFLNPRAYSILHQKHHYFSDTYYDPHSPKNSKSLVSMMLRTYHAYRRLIDDQGHEWKYLKKCYPTWSFIDKIGDTWGIRVFWILFYLAIYLWLVPWGWGYLLLPFHFIVGPMQGAVVNWCGHKYGYQNFDNKDQSKNTLFVDILLMGELYQNNHHKFPKRANFAARWFECDLTFLLMKPLQLLRIIRPVSQS